MRRSVKGPRKLIGLMSFCLGVSAIQTGCALNKFCFPRETLGSLFVWEGDDVLACEGDYRAPGLTLADFV